MAPTLNPPTWPKARQRELAEALGSSDAVLLRDLAVAWQRAALRGPRLPKERADDALGQAAFDADVKRLRRATSALATAAAALQGLTTPFFRGSVDDGLGPNWRAEIARWHKVIGLDARWRSTRRRRGAPASEARYLAHDVADVLEWHGIRLTTYPDGRFGLVLDIMLRSLNLSADVGGLVRAMTKARNRSSE